MRTNAPSSLILYPSSISHHAYRQAHSQQRATCVRQSGGREARSGEQEAESPSHSSLLAPSSPLSLLPDFQSFQQIEILLGIDPLHVIQEPTTPTYHSQQTTPAGIVLRMEFQMIGHLGNPTGEQRNLDFRRARVAGSASKFTLQLLFPLFRKLHDVSRLRPSPLTTGYRAISLWCAAYPVAPPLPGGPRGRLFCLG